MTSKNHVKKPIINSELFCKLTSTEIEIVKGIIETDLKMIQFLKGFKKSKSIYEIKLEKILGKFISFNKKGQSNN